MDRLFRKKTGPSGEKRSKARITSDTSEGVPISPAPTASASASAPGGSSSLSPVAEAGPSRLRKQRSPRDSPIVEEQRTKTPDKAPSLDVTIRTSLILPGLSERFSVLLPSLYTTPEDDLRNLIATQRARGGPSITEEEEELLLAEIRGSDRPRTASNASQRAQARRNGIPSPSNATGVTPLGNGSSSSVGRIHPFPQASGSRPAGGSTDPSSSDAGASMIRTKSYGFSGGSSMRDGEYIRRMKRSASGRNVSDSSEAIEEAAPSRVGRPPPISTERANGYSHKKSQSVPESPTTSSHTATPTSGTFSAALPVSNGSHSRSQSVTVSRESSQDRSASHAAAHGRTGSTVSNRKSSLAGLTPAQAKRISAALMEIDGRLRMEGPRAERLASFSRSRGSKFDEEEEMLDGVTDIRTGSAASDRDRKPSDASTLFPYQVSPVASTSAIGLPPADLSSTSRLPPSPKSYDLQAHVQPREPPPAQPSFASRSPVAATNSSQPSADDDRLAWNPAMPLRVLTPSRTKPIRHTPTPSTSSIGSGTAPAPAYIPGQPRPVGSMHRSEGSQSSRSGTPNTAAARESPTASVRVRADSQPTSATAPQQLPDQSTSGALGRSLSVSSGGPQRQAGSPIIIPARNMSLPVRPTEPVNSAVSSSSSRAGSAMDKHTASAAPTIHEDEEASEYGTESDGEGDTSTEIRNVLDTRNLSMSAVALAAQQPAPSARSAQVSLPDDNADRPSFSSEGSAFKGGDDFEGDDYPSDAKMRGDSESDDNSIRAFTRLTGLTLADMRAMQDLLVQRAKAEREALRAETGSTLTRSTTSVKQSPSLPARSNSARGGAGARKGAPPSAWRDHQPAADSGPQPSQASKGLSPVVLGPVVQSPPPGDRAPRGLQRSGSSAGGRQTPQPPSRKESLTGGTHLDAEQEEAKRKDFEARIAAATAALNRAPSVKLERKPTKRGQPMVISSPTLVSSSAVIPGASPEAVPPATAKALEKASGSASKMGSRWKKLGFRKGPSISGDDTTPSVSPHTISTPRLEDPITLRGLSGEASEQSSPDPGSSTPRQNHDLSAFRFPPMSADAVQPHNSTVVNSPPGTANPTSGLKQMLGRLKRGPSDAKAEQSAARLYRSPSVPHQDPSVRAATPVARPAVPATAPQSHVAAFPMAPAIPGFESGKHHARTASVASTDSHAVAQFIAAGKALGLNDQQLEEMLASKGMIAPSARSGSSLSAETPILAFTETSRGSPTPLATPTVERQPSVSGGGPSKEVSRKPSFRRVKKDKDQSGGGDGHQEKKEPMGLFRSFSKRKQAAPVPAPDSAPVPTPPPAMAEQARVSESRDRVVRRTLVMPEGAGFPMASVLAEHQLRQQQSQPQQHQHQQLLQQPYQLITGSNARKPSIKRKPINLSAEDQDLVNRSPGGRIRQTSVTSTASAHSEGGMPGSPVTRFAESDAPAGTINGLLAPVDLNGSTSTRRSVSGQSAHGSMQSNDSLYELYEDQEEELASPDTITTPDMRRTMPPPRHSVQALELTEYEDGRVAWSIANVLRTDGRDGTESLASHSPQLSISSRGMRDSTAGGDENELPSWKIGAGQLALRHRDRGGLEPRPITNVFYTQPEDLGDLIDHLSRDQGASRGRIDLLPPRTITPMDENAILKEQFADASSPPSAINRRAAPPPPLNLSSPGRTPDADTGGSGETYSLAAQLSPNRHVALRADGAPGTQPSPSAASFASSVSGAPTRSVEDRLQALLDKLQASGAGVGSGAGSARRDRTMDV